MAQLSRSLSLIPNDPELLFGLVAPLGADLTSVEKALQKALEEVGYRYEPPIRVVSEAEKMLRNLVSQWKASNPEQHTAHISETEAVLSVTAENYQYKMNVGNHLRKLLDMPDALAVLSVFAIRNCRKTYHEKAKIQDVGDGNKPIARQAYVAHQLKRPEEVETLRRIYGDAFILLGVYSTKQKRIDHLASRMYSGGMKYASMDDAKLAASALVQRDAEEDGNKSFGQSVRKTFALADAFIDGDLPESELEKSVSRLIRLLFWHPAMTPTKEEYAMFLAQGAALRSADLGRQVGAAILTEDGQVLSLGCNEVARPGGGLLWGDQSPDMRDVGYQSDLDVSTTEKLRILEELLQRLQSAGWVKGDRNIDHRSLLSLARNTLKDTRLMGLIEFLRPVHAEMAALMDAARRGIAVAGGILFSTTFPCHECAKHIVAAGMKKVIFIEPYPKSQVEVLYRDAISIEGGSVDKRLPFVPFIGVAPRRYQSFFAMPDKILDAKGKTLMDGRRDENGRIVDWAAICKTLSPKLRGYDRLYREHEVEMIHAMQEAIEYVNPKAT